MRQRRLRDIAKGRLNGMQDRQQRPLHALDGRRGFRRPAAVDFGGIEHAGDLWLAGRR